MTETYGRASISKCRVLDMAQRAWGAESTARHAPRIPVHPSFTDHRSSFIRRSSFTLVHRPSFTLVHGILVLVHDTLVLVHGELISRSRILVHLSFTDHGSSFTPRSSFTLVHGSSFTSFTSFTDPRSPLVRCSPSFTDPRSALLLVQPGWPWLGWVDLALAGPGCPWPAAGLGWPWPALAGPGRPWLTAAD